MQREVLSLGLALVLTFFLPGHAASPNCTAERLEFQPVFESGFSQLSGDVGSLEPLYNMVNLYLDTVQPNPFPTDIIEQILKTQLVEPLKVVKYEAGYLVSLIIGALFFILMPLVGLFFCCCRCCNRCGGQVKERTGLTDCQRNALALFLLMTTIIILAGVACAFTANQKVTDAMEPSVAVIKDTLANAMSYVDNIVKAIAKITKQFSVPKEQTLTELGRIDRTLGSTIQDTLAPIITPVLAMFMTRIQELSRIKNHLLTIASSQISLQESQKQLKDNLTRIQGEINATLRSGCVNCESVRLAVENLELNINYSRPPELQILLERFTNISEDTLNNSLQKGNQTFNEIPARVRNQTSRILSEANTTLGNIERQIQGITEKLSVIDKLQNLNNTLDPSQLDEIFTSVKQYDYYRWIVGIVLCCIVLLIIACNVLGLGLGTTGIATRTDPYGANCPSQSGANFLMAGVGFSFIFSWLLILLVFVTFFVGGNVQTLVCKPWESGEIYKAVDTLAAASGDLNLSNLLGVQVSVSELHRRCEKGDSLFNFLPENQKTQLNKALNLSTYTADLEKVEELNVDLGTIILLDSASNSTLMDFANSEIDGLNYTQFIEQVQQPIVKTQLLPLADQLDALASSQNIEVKNRLSQHSADLRELQRTSMSAIAQELATLNASFRFLASSAPTIKGKIQKTLQSTATAESQIKPSILTVLRNVSQCLLSKGRGYFTQYLDWARSTIIDDLFSCQPVVILLENSRVIACEYITNPWNAFWFCLGWCTFSLIPSIIFAVKTAKHYRPVKNKASSPDFAEMTNLKFPRAQNKYSAPGTNLYASPTF